VTGIAKQLSMGTDDRGMDMMNFLRRLMADNNGATAVEYSLIIALIMLAIVSAVSGVATTTTDMWNNVSTIVSENA
jgi:pilus assembly protein Flp/PilA